MFRTILLRSRLMREAKALFRARKPIPLGLYAALDELGVDIDELERNA